jgi:hypothetical protein
MESASLFSGEELPIIIQNVLVYGIAGYLRKLHDERPFITIQEYLSNPRHRSQGPTPYSAAMGIRDETSFIEQKHGTTLTSIRVCIIYDTLNMSPKKG